MSQNEKSLNEQYIAEIICCCWDQNDQRMIILLILLSFKTSLSKQQSVNISAIAERG